jgi:hypothetical protein
MNLSLMTLPSSCDGMPSTYLDAYVWQMNLFFSFYIILKWPAPSRMLIYLRGMWVALGPLVTEKKNLPRKGHAFILSRAYFQKFVMTHVSLIATSRCKLPFIGNRHTCTPLNRCACHSNGCHDKSTMMTTWSAWNPPPVAGDVYIYRVSWSS